LAQLQISKWKTFTFLLFQIYFCYWTNNVCFISHFTYKHCAQIFCILSHNRTRSSTTMSLYLSLHTTKAWREWKLPFRDPWINTRLTKTLSWKYFIQENDELTTAPNRTSWPRNIHWVDDHPHRTSFTPHTHRHTHTHTPTCWDF
jgi:hypothetical protein